MALIASYLRQVRVSYAYACAPAILDNAETKVIRGLNVFVSGEFSVTPQVLQLVKLAGFGVENVDDGVEIIKTDPFGHLAAVYGFGVFAQFSLEPGLHIFGDGGYLRNGFTLADNKKVSRAIVELAQVDLYDVFTFDVLHAINDNI